VNSVAEHNLPVNAEIMLDKDVERLSEPYPPASPADGSPLLRLAGQLGLNLESEVRLGDEIFADLDTATYGIGWWKSYPGLDRQARIFLSDYLVACARAIPDNLVEARIELLELDHAAEDYRRWMSRGMNGRGRLAIEPPQSPNEELSNQRVRTHLAGALRAWGSALDCVGGCIIGAAGLPADLVKADLRLARDTLAKHSPGNQVLQDLQAGLEKAEADAGPAGWRNWLLGMRHTIVHRGRRTTSWSGTVEPNGDLSFNLLLPVAPDRTEIDAITLCGGVIAATFQAPAAEMLSEMGKTVDNYVSAASGILADLWCARRGNPALLDQDAKQWKKPNALIIPPEFRGFPHLTPPETLVTSYNVSPEDERRMRSAAVRPDIGDVKPDPAVWN
jgi:hypothetical protein